MTTNREERTHPHLELAREEPVNNRRPPRGFPRPTEPVDSQAHGARLRERLRMVRRDVADDLGGYDDRRLIRIELSTNASPDEIARASGSVAVVSQEEGSVLLAFATESQLDDFEAKLSSLATGERVSYANLLYALEDLGRWTEEDRTGWALHQDGFPDEEPFVIDAELWPLTQGSELTRQRQVFEEWLGTQDGEIVDSVRQPYLTLYRIRCNRALAEDLLRYRDVRTLDLPPRIGLERAILVADVQQLGQTPSPPDDAPRIVVLDSGLVAGHPVLSPAIGDAQSFPSSLGANDEDGHGTSVAGIALYDDVADCIRNGRFVPELRLFSGRIFDSQNTGYSSLIENRVDEAVRYFVREYGCKVFNLSYGDLNKPYQGRRVSGLAVTLDALSRELNVLFLVPTGNYLGDADGPDDWRAEYPCYLTGERARLIDPAPALNALTVGSLARYDMGRPNQRYPDDPAYRPVARTNQPSPFTRRGPSVNGAIKPELVDYGGNWMMDTRAGNHLMVGQQGVGEISTSRGFAAGRPFTEDSGTSFAAPRVANAAAKILAGLPNASPDLCRALLVAHARKMEAWDDLFPNENDALWNVTGYGQVDRSALFRSLDDCVTLWAEERIENRHHHFYRIPVPREFWQGGKRQRELTIALAYRPAVRTTRIDYRATSIGFRLVQAGSLDEVTRAFNAASDRDADPAIKERDSGRSISETARSRGTVQASTWAFAQPSSKVQESSWFVVVTRNDSSWGGSISSEREHYALTVTLSDRLAEQQRLHAPQLYAQVQALIQVQARARI